MNRTIFLVDGFNLYHSLGDTGLKHAKWLNLKAMCESYLSVAAQARKEKASLECIHYFSAVPFHRNQEKVDRHSLYIGCLEDSGIIVHLGRFKKKDVYCPKCRQRFTTHEEKESDVAIGIELFKQCNLNAFDTAILVTGDTDLNPAVRTCKELFPEKTIFFLFPYMRKNKELEKIAPESVSIKPKAYFTHQFPDRFLLHDGSEVTKPATW
jgi:uncharacterized LabA/DUF88 family protein